jgi:hypothetical protein
MSGGPVICFGQQPCGIFPRRFLYAKIATARKLQSEMGGKIVFFYHDSDHDPHETQTIVQHRKTGQPATLNFTFENKVQRKYSPLYLKRVVPAWRETALRQLPAYVDAALVEAFRQTKETTVGDFCLEMYRKMGLLEGIEVIRSSDPAFRESACEIEDYFVDVPWEREIVRARRVAEGFELHEGGGSVLKLPGAAFEKKQVSPTRDTRLRWMQSIVRCTHYVCGAGEQAYLHKEEAPDIVFVNRDPIERSDEAYIGES